MIPIFVIFLSVTSASADETPWLPKCCPSGMQIASDGKACVDDVNLNYAYNASDTDTLTIAADTNVTYRLEHRSKFNCVRHELFVIDNDIAVTPDGRVAATDVRGDEWVLAPEEVCVDSVYLPGLVPERVFVALLCPDCRKVRCLHKCCPESKNLRIGEAGDEVDCVESDTDTSWADQVVDNQQVVADRPLVFHGFPDCANQMYLEYLYTWDLEEHGHLRLGRGPRVPRAHYCLDDSDRGPALLACRLRPSVRTVVYGGLFVLGAVFLGVTLALHLWLPELRKSLHSRVLVAHVACLMAGYVGLAVANLAPIPAPSCGCSIAAFAIQFFILSSMFWLNVMCVDIAWTFSGLRAPKASQSMDSDGHKFVYYSLYAWGGSAIISAITAFLEFSPLVSPLSKLKPSFGTTRCWFEYWETVLLLVYGPMGLLLATNVVLFAYTAFKIRQTQRDTANMVQHAGSKLRKDTNRFSLYLKLFGLMGVTWVMELVSWVVGGSESYWYVTDTINVLRGFFIFVLFCCKKKVLALIKSKMHKGDKPKFPIHPRKSAASSRMTSSLTSQRTNSIQLSQIS